MGRAGSIARWEGGEESTSLACILSVKRASGKENDMCHVVDCKLEGNSATLQQRFTSLGPEDPEGKAAALCFALSTGSLSAFRAFLFEHLEFWSSRSGDGYNASCLTGAGCFTVFVSSRKNTALGLCFTAAICRLHNGCLRSISFRCDSEQVGIERVTRFLHGSKCRSWVHKVLKRNSTSEPGAVPATCKRCGESEHPPYHDQKSQQACEDYLCSACLMMEKEVILAIRLEEQSEGAENWEKFLNEGGSVCVEDNCDTCCICGCEDNEDLDDLVPCACKSSQAIVHNSCAAACATVTSPKFSNLGSTSLCFICGRGQGILKNGGLGRCQDDGIGVGGLKRSMNSSQVAGVEAKRPRMKSADDVKQIENIDSFPNIIERESNLPAVQIECEDTECSKMGLARHRWRSADVPAVVPFKKRRIQIIEVPRSPSPSPKQISPKVVPLCSPITPSLLLEPTSVKPATLLPKSFSSKLDCLPLDSPSLDATSLLPGSSSPKSLPSSKSTSPAPVIYSPNKTPCMSITRATPEPPRSFSSPPQPPQQTCPLPRSLSPQPTSLPPKLLIRSSGSWSPQQTCPSPRALSLKPTSLQARLSRSSGSSPLHCPKLLAVETSEQSGDNSLKRSEQGLSSQRPGACCEGFHHLKVIKESHASYEQSSRCFANQNRPSSSQEVEDGELVISTDKGLDDFEAAGDLPEVCSQEARDHHARFVRSKPGGFHDDRSGWDLNTDMDTWDKLSDHVHARKKMGKSSRTTRESIKRNIHMSRQIVAANEPLKKSSSELLKGHIDINKHEECGIEKVAANGKKLAFIIGASVQRSEGLGKLEIRNNAPEIENSSSWKEGEATCENQGVQRYGYAAKREDRASLLREEWDELAEDPEGEHVDYGDFNCRDGDDSGMAIADRSLMLEDEAYWRVEDTMGDPSYWESKTTSDGGGSERRCVHLIESCMENCSTSGRIKSSGWDQLPEGFNSAEEALKAAQEILSCRGRGYWANPGRRGPIQGSLSGNRYNSRRDEFRDSSSRFGDRGVGEPSHGRESYNHTRRLDNSLDDYSTAWGRGLGRVAGGVRVKGHFNVWSDNERSSFSGQWRPGRHRSFSGFSSQGATNAAAVAAARVESSGFVVAPDRTISRGGRRPGILRSTFENSHRAREPHSNGQTPLTDLENRPNPPSRMDRHMGRNSNIRTDMGARQGAGPRYAGSMSERGALAGHGNVDRYGGSFYRGRSAELRRSESPRRLHPSDHSHMSGRAPCRRPESRVTRSRLSPPSLEPYRLSKVFPGSARGQLFPPFRKWSYDRREAENFRERDFKRLIPRSHGSSGRTSPHVVHGSSLMDERDWRVLAGTRSSPGARGGLNSPVHSGRSMDNSADLHRSRRAEEEEHTHSISKDSDHSTNSPREFDGASGSAFKRGRIRDDDKKRDFYRLSSRSTGGVKLASS